MSAFLPSNRYVRYALGLFQQFIGSGIVFGWPAMLSMLQNEGVYGHFCPNQPITDCNEATIKFNAIFNAGSFGNTGASLVFGWLLDRFGQRVTSVVGHLLMIMGVLLFAFSSNSHDFFLEGYLLIGIAGNPLQLAVLAFCNEFENASTAMSVNCGVFAASSALFMILKAIVNSTGVSLRVTLLGFCIVLGVSLVLGILLLPPLPPQKAGVASKRVFSRDHRVGSAASLLSSTRPASAYGTMKLYEGFSAMLLDNRMSLTDIGSQVDDRDVDARSYHTQGSEASINTASTVPRTIAEHLKAAPFKHQLLDRVYLCGVYFAMVHVLSINFYVGTSSKQLDRLGDTGHYQNTFSAIIPFGAVLVPLTGPIFHRFGALKTMFLYELLSLLYIIPVTIPSLPLQYLTFVMVASLRPYSFASVFNFVNLMYSQENFGKLLGIASMMGGIASLLQTPLLSIALHTCRGNFLWVNIALIGAQVPLFFTPRYLERHMEKATTAT